VRVPAVSLGALLVAASVGACGGRSESAFSRWRSCLASGRAGVSAPASIRPAAEQWAARLTALGPPRFSLVPAGARDELVAIHAGRGFLSGHGPVAVTAEGLAVAGEIFRDPSDVALVAWAPASPPYVLLGLDPSAVADLLPFLDLPRNPCVRIFRGGAREAEWELAPDGSARLDSARRPGARLREFVEWGGAATPGLRFLVPPSDAGGSAPPSPGLLAILGATLGRVEAMAGARIEGPLPIFVHPHPEDLAAATGVLRLAHAEPAARRLHVIPEEEARGEAASELARLAARSLLGRPAEAWMEIGLAAACSEERAGMALPELGARLRRCGGAVSLADLREEARRVRLSPLRVEATAAALIAGVFAAAGPERWRRFYRGEEAPWTDGELEATLAASLDRWAWKGPPSPRGGSPRRALGTFGQGVHLDAGGEELSRRSFDESLEALRRTGVRWISLRVPAPLRRGWEEASLDCEPSDGDAPDPSVLAWAVRRAHRSGLLVALGPPFFAAVSEGRWVEGDERPRPRGLDPRPSRALDAALHLALVAEAAGADLLFLGGEGGAPPGEWSRTLSACRGIYSGPIAFRPGSKEGALAAPPGFDYLALSPRGGTGADPAAQAREIAEAARGQRALAIVIEAGEIPAQPSPSPEDSIAALESAIAFLREASRRPEIPLVLWRRMDLPSLSRILPAAAPEGGR
jgi:hypothetical protein